MTDMLRSLAAKLHTEVASARSARPRILDQEGAEVVQVIMIMGIMAILVVALFFTDIGLKQAILDLGQTVKDKLTDAGTN
jgi:hypothetical protein